MAPLTRLFSTSKSEEKGGGHSVPGAWATGLLSWGLGGERRALAD